MKTFSTSGTGNQQTLSEIESDKMPIYDSVTDAEADLANLEEGQILATKDEGSELSAPVDTVQSGNMHAVTSNAVAKAGSYSTTEHRTGRYWTDGKPTYEKTLEGLITATSFAVAHNIADIDTLVNINSISVSSSGDILSSYYLDANYYFMASADKTSLTIFTGNSAVNQRNYRVTLEYTKTTD